MNTNTTVVALVGASALVIGGVVGYVLMPPEIQEVEVEVEVPVEVVQVPRECIDALALAESVNDKHIQVREAQGRIISDIFPRVMDAIVTNDAAEINALTEEVRVETDFITSVDTDKETNEYITVVQACVDAVN